jgi:hypothetical protein
LALSKQTLALLMESTADSGDMQSVRYKGCCGEQSSVVTHSPNIVAAGLLTFLKVAAYPQTEWSRLGGYRGGHTG